LVLFLVVSDRYHPVPLGRLPFLPYETDLFPAPSSSFVFASSFRTLASPQFLATVCTPSAPPGRSFTPPSLFSGPHGRAGFIRPAEVPQLLQSPVGAFSSSLHHSSFCFCRAFPNAPPSRRVICERDLVPSLISKCPRSSA